MAPARRIILVEPDDAVRTALTFSLEVQGFHVETAEASQALARLDEEDACLVVDHTPHSADALQLLSRLASRPSKRPAVVLATHPGRSLRAAVAAAGGVLVEKPLLGDGLNEALRFVFDQPRADRLKWNRFAIPLKP